MNQKTTEKTTKNRETDKPAGVSRSLIFILAVVISITLTIIGLYSLDLLTFKEDKQKVLDRPVQKTKIIDYSQDIYKLKQVISTIEQDNNNFFNNIKQLQNQLDNLPKEVATTPIIQQEKQSPLVILNYLLINYQTGGNITNELEYINNKINNKELKIEFEKLLKVSKPKVITKNKLFMAIKYHKKKQTPEKLADNNTKKSLLDKFIVIRKKTDVPTSKTKIIHSLMKDNIQTFEEVFKQNNKDLPQRVQEKIKAYIAQQQAFNSFKNMYINMYMGDANVSD